MSVSPISDPLAYGFMFLSGFAWGCWFYGHWLLGGFVMAMAFGLLARLAWESSKTGRDGA